MAVTMYSTPQCTFCKQLKRWFQERHVAFREYDVAKDARRADEMLKKSGQTGVPVVDGNGTVIVGFDRDKLERALRR